MDNPKYTLSYHHFPDCYYHDQRLSGRVSQYLQERFPGVNFSWTLLPNEHRSTTVDPETFERIKQALNVYPLGWTHVDNTTN